MLKTAAVALIVFFLMASAAEAVVKINKHRSILNSDDNKHIGALDETYKWEDDFENAQKIDMDLSENYIVKDGKVEMYGTEPMWTDPSFTRMKIITLESSISDNDVAIKIIVNYDSDMRSDYGDLRFKFQDENSYLSYWIEEKNPEPNDPYAIVWLKIPSLPSGTSKIYMFYGNPGATDQSDYWSVFDENSWNKEYVHDHQVTYHWYKEGAWDPDVCYGHNRFLVTWEEGTAFWPAAGTIFQQQIRGRFYNVDGEPISSRFDIVDEPDETPPYRYENPSCAYGKNGKFFVAYERYNNPVDNNAKLRDIEGAIVDEDEPVDGASERFTICNADNIQADPCVAYDPNHERFLVVWEDARQGTSNYDIYGRFYDTSGNPIGGDFALYDEPNTQCEPWVCFDNVNNHYMVVWEESIDQPDTGPFEIWGQLFDWQGNPLGSAKRISQQSSSSTDYNFPCVAFCELTETFLVTWQSDDISSDDWNGNIYGRMLDENGGFTGPGIIDIAIGQYCRTDVVPYLSTSFFVAYDNQVGSTGDIWGKMVNPDGTVNQYTLQLSDDDTEPCDWVNIAEGKGKIFVTWEDTRIEYQWPFDDMPDVYANVWSLNIPAGSDVSYSFGDEQSLILQAHIVSKPISPSNWLEWDKFDAVKDGNVDFDILDAETLEVLKNSVSPGARIDDISSSSIRLRAQFTRNNPSTTPSLDSWSVTYYGVDSEPPETWVKNIEGVKGLNDYYISETVKVLLDAKDYPADTGSGVYKTWYRVKPEGGSWSEDREYTTSGITLIAPEDSKQGTWEINFWSEDNAYPNHNVENRDKPQNYRTVKIDWGIPYVTIIEPQNEQEFQTTGFWVRATAEDNVKVDRVEFDASPYGERPGLPYVDTEPPYEWWCDVSKIARSKSLETEPNPAPGTNLYLRAIVYDPAGHSYYSEIVVYIDDWKSHSAIKDSRLLSIINHIPWLFNLLKLRILYSVL